MRNFTKFAVALLFLTAAERSLGDMSEGLYRLPYADGTQVKVFDDFDTHRPSGRIDFFAIEVPSPVKIVAAADGIVVAVQDDLSEQQSGRAAKDCHNNYVWIAHSNGEWSNYSHVAYHSASETAGLRKGMKVAAGQFIGYEGAVGCAMLDHVHFEVARPAADALDEGGFLRDNEDGKREVRPRFCTAPGQSVAKDRIYIANPCGR